jgi:hypothetical protein
LGNVVGIHQFFEIRLQQLLGFGEGCSRNIQPLLFILRE